VIHVNGVRCIVRLLYAPESMEGVCQVVFNRQKPTTHDVDWDGETWFFPQRQDFGGYARPSDPYVQMLLA